MLESNDPSRHARPCRALLAAALTFTALLPARAIHAAIEGDVTLARILALAAERSPDLAVAAARLRAAEADLLAARVFRFNPELEGSRTRRESEEQRTNDREIGLSQELEVAGQRGKRIDAAEAALEGAKARFARASQELAARVESRFVEAIAAVEILRITESEREIAATLAAFERRRLEAGASTQIDLNLALAALGRAERRLELARAAEAGARARLAESIGLAPSELGRPLGDLRTAWPEPPETLELERRALANRTDLVALKHEAEAAKRRVRLERSSAMPNLTVGAASGREEATDDLTIFSAGFAIPLFDRNQGGIASARAAESEQLALVAAAELAVRREVAEVRSLYEATLRARAALAEGVEGTLEENLELLQKSLAAGKLRASEVLLFRRELVDSRRELVEASAEAWQARIALDLATGNMTTLPVPSTSPTPEPPR